MALRRQVSIRSISNIRRFSSIVNTPDLPEVTKRDLLKNLNTYTQTLPPNPAQLDYAYTFFTSQTPQFLFGTSKFREFPASSSPEITFLGRSNVGKSSLLNALFNRPHDRLAFVSKRPGRTRAMNAFGIGGASVGGARRVAKAGMSLEMMAEGDLKKGSEMRNFIGRGGLVVVDPPGYGHGSREEWGKEVVKYLQGRKQYVEAVYIGIKDFANWVADYAERFCSLMRSMALRLLMSISLISFMKLVHRIKSSSRRPTRLSFQPQRPQARRDFKHSSTNYAIGPI
jgi:GTP-binding protein EngB required for normal cell division